MGSSPCAPTRLSAKTESLFLRYLEPSSGCIFDPLVRRKMMSGWSVLPQCLFQGSERNEVIDVFNEADILRNITGYPSAQKDWRQVKVIGATLSGQDTMLGTVTRDDHGVYAQSPQINLKGSFAKRILIGLV